MNAGTISTVIMTALMVIAAIGGALAWFYKRGGQEKSNADATEENTKAVRELIVELRGFKESTVHRLHEHDLTLVRHDSRLQALEGIKGQ